MSRPAWTPHRRAGPADAQARANLDLGADGPLLRHPGHLPARPSDDDVHRRNPERHGHRRATHHFGEQHPVDHQVGDAADPSDLHPDTRAATQIDLSNAYGAARVHRVAGAHDRLWHDIVIKPHRDIPMTPSPGPVVVDFAPARIRHPVDLIRLTLLVVALLIIAGLGAVASDTVRGAGMDLARLVRGAPYVFVHLLSVLGAVAALAVPLGLMVAEIARGHSRRLIEGLITGLAAIGLIVGLDWLLAVFPASALYRGLTGVGAGRAVRPLDAYLAALLALVTGIGLPGNPLWRRLRVAMIALYVTSVFTGTQTSMLSPLSSMTIGAMVGVLVRYVAGRANVQPGGVRIAAELTRRGIPLTRLERVHETDPTHRSYLATRLTGGRLMIHVLDRDLLASGVV